MKLNLGCGRNIMEGWVNIDGVASPGVDLVWNLDEQHMLRLPYEDDSVDELLLSHVIEHLHYPLPLMQELHRVAKPGAIITIRCPYGSSDDADEDPTHVRRMYRGSFGYFSQPYYWRADYGYRGDWEIDTLHLWVASRLGNKPAGDVQIAIERERNVVREIVCVLHAVKPIRPPDRALQRYPQIITHVASF